VQSGEKKSYVKMNKRDSVGFEIGAFKTQNERSGNPSSEALSAIPLVKFFLHQWMKKLDLETLVTQPIEQSHQPKNL
jgi:hypothetical protein